MQQVLNMLIERTHSSRCLRTYPTPSTHRYIISLLRVIVSPSLLEIQVP